VNILLVNWQDSGNPRAGGAEQHLFALFTRLAARGHRVRLVCSGWDGAAPRTEIDGIAVQRVSTRNGFALHGRGAVRAALAAEPPDILVEDINKLPLFTASLTDAPICALIPHLFGTTAFTEVSLPLATMVWLAERPLARAYARAGWHAISESTRDDLVQRGVPFGRIRVIHPGVDSKYFTSDPNTSRSKAPSFLYVGRLQRYKGVETAIRAVVEARRTRGDLHLDVAGTGPYRPALERLVDALGAREAVTFHGFISEEEKRRMLRATWANVLPSAKEGWGITVMEAAACGTPSLASDRPGLRDSVRNGQTGLLVPHGDSTALAAQMLRLAQDPALVAQLGAAARDHAEQTSWEAAADATEAHLVGLTHGRP
jgi:glycosyltransferase involved in cell wall biosynthesis